MILFAGRFLCRFRLFIFLFAGRHLYRFRLFIFLFAGRLLRHFRLFAFLLGSRVQRHRRSVQRSANEASCSVVNEFEREKGLVLCQEAEEYFVPLPYVEVVDLLLRNPFKDPFVTFDGFSFKTIRSEKMHIFRSAVTGNKGDDSPEPVGGQRIACFFPDFAHKTLVRTLVLLEVAAHSDPFVLIDVVFLYDPVQHQVFPVPLQIAKRTKLCFQIIPPAVPWILYPPWF